MNFAETERKLTLVVEGPADEKFLKDYCAENFSSDMSKVDFIKLDTDWHGLNKFKNQILRGFDKGGILLILDADTPNHNEGGFNKRLAAITAWLEKVKVTAQVFLWPNNSNDGNLETLLQNIIVKEHEQIFVCFEKYEECLRAGEKGYVTPNEKAKVYAYAYALSEKGEEASDVKRNYRNPNVWNLKSDFLQPLNQFLAPHIQA
jgi:hypothetical protein